MTSSSFNAVLRSFAAGLIGVFVLIACAGESDNTDAVPVSAAEATSDSAEGSSAGVVNLYSGRHYDSDLALFEAFTKETGIKVNIVEANGDALIERLRREGGSSPADLFMTADAGVLWRAQSKGLLQPITSEEVLSRVQERFRHPSAEWVGLSKRARIVIFNKEMGLPEGLATYGDLADPAFKGMVCVRSSTNVYNQSLLASIVARDGAEAAEEWAKGVVANFARKPQGNDTSQIEAVAAGLCRVAIVNSYYVARFIGSDNDKNRAIGDKIDVLFPSQETTGTHVNISGAGLAQHAPNRNNAEGLIAFLLRDDNQQAFAGGNNEYPIVEGVAPTGPVAALGTFREDDLPVAALGENQAEAVRIFDRAEWP